MTDTGPTDQTVLVTGGAGFIGSHLVDSLVADNDVRVIDDLSTGKRENVHPDATLIEADLRNSDALLDALDGVDVVFHQAAQVSVQRSVESPRKSFSTNTVPSLEILDHARERGFRVVIASSCAIYGDPIDTPIDESHRTEPQSPYGLEKLTVDRYARLYHELYGVESIALRYFNVYGPRQSGGDYSGVIGIFNRQAMADEPLTVEGDGRQTRDFVHVDDVVRANLLAAETEAVGEAYNVGTGTTVTIKGLAELINDLSGTDASIQHVDGREGDIEESQADVSKIRNRMGFEPTIDLADGLELLLQ